MVSHRIGEKPEPMITGCTDAYVWVKKYFHTNFIPRLLYFASSYTWICPWGPINNMPSIDSDNGWVPNKPHVIIWTNYDIVYWRIYGSLGMDELWICVHVYARNNNIDTTKESTTCSIFGGTCRTLFSLQPLHCGFFIFRLKPIFFITKKFKWHTSCHLLWCLLANRGC